MFAHSARDQLYCSCLYTYADKCLEWHNVLKIAVQGISHDKHMLQSGGTDFVLMGSKEIYWMTFFLLLGL